MDAVIRTTVIEVAAVSVAAATLAVGFYLQQPVARVTVGNRTWTVSWAVPAEDAASGGDQLTAAFPDGRAHDQSLREVVDLSLGGAALRVRFTNEYGDAPLRLARVTVAPSRQNGAVDKARMRTLQFNGVPATVVAAGTEATSDPLPMAVVAGEQLAVSMAVTGTSPSPTMHQFAGRRSGISGTGTGDVTRHGDGAAYATHTNGDFWLATVEVLNSPKSVKAIAALGDSQTDAYFLTDGDLTWPQLLGQRLAATPATAAIGIIDSGLTGNTVIDVGCRLCGAPMDERVIRDAVNLPGATGAVVLGGTNDITHGATARDIVHGLASVAAILHVHGLRAVAMTIPPRAGGSYGWVPATMEHVRLDVNGWLRAQKDFDGLVDADLILRDPGHPGLLAPIYDRGDGTHLSASGRSALAAAIPIGLLGR
ncbi:MAG: GDSL-type esterase/lipase family protein [Acidimicrobiales bacterium]